MSWWEPTRGGARPASASAARGAPRARPSRRSRRRRPGRRTSAGGGASGCGWPASPPRSGPPPRARPVPRRLRRPLRSRPCRLPALHRAPSRPSRPRRPWAWTGGGDANGSVRLPGSSSSGRAWLSSPRSTLRTPSQGLAAQSRRPARLRRRPTWPPSRLLSLVRGPCSRAGGGGLGDASLRTPPRPAWPGGPTLLRSCHDPFRPGNPVLPPGRSAGPRASSVTTRASAAAAGTSCSPPAGPVTTGRTGSNGSSVPGRGTSPRRGRSGRWASAGGTAHRIAGGAVTAPRFT